MFDVTRTIKITLKRYRISKQNTNTLSPAFSSVARASLPNFSLPARFFLAVFAASATNSNPLKPPATQASMPGQP